MADRQIAWADFDAMLADMPAASRAESPTSSASPLTPTSSQTIALGPLMSRYSKALEYEYQPDLRRELIAEADALSPPRHRRAPLPCFDAAAEKSPLLARALSRAEG